MLGLTITDKVAVPLVSCQVDAERDELHISMLSTALKEHLHQLQRQATQRHITLSLISRAEPSHFMPHTLGTQMIKSKHDDLKIRAEISHIGHTAKTHTNTTTGNTKTHGHLMLQ